MVLSESMRRQEEGKREEWREGQRKQDGKATQRGWGAWVFTAGSGLFCEALSRTRTLFLGNLAEPLAEPQSHRATPDNLGHQHTAPPKQLPNLETISFFLYLHSVWSLAFLPVLYSISPVSLKRFSLCPLRRLGCNHRVSLDWKLLVSRNYISWLWKAVSKSAGHSGRHWWMNEWTVLGLMEHLCHTPITGRPKPLGGHLPCRREQ